MPGPPERAGRTFHVEMHTECGLVSRGASFLYSISHLSEALIQNNHGLTRSLLCHYSVLKVFQVLAISNKLDAERTRTYYDPDHTWIA